MSRTRRYFYCFGNHPLILKLSLIVFIFTINLSKIDIKNEYQNRRLLLDFEYYYSNILWRYLNYLFDEKEAIKTMEVILMQILRYQILMINMENFVQQISDNQEFHSLMKSVFDHV